MGEADKSEDEVEDGGDDDEDELLPARSGQQVEGLVLHGERPNVVPQKCFSLTMGTGVDEEDIAN